MKFRKLIFAAAAITALAVPFNAYAASETAGLTKITSIKLTVNTPKPETGDSIEDPVDVKSDTEGVIIASAYFDQDDDEWTRNDIPVLKVEMDAEDGYYFGSVKLTSVTGLSRISSKTVKKDGDKYHAIATIKLKKVTGKVDDPEDVSWNGTWAEWDDVEGATYYNVRLKRDDKRVVTISTNDTKFDFFPWMTKTGDYTFDVKAMTGKSSDNSDWSDESDALDISSNDTYRGTTPSYTDFRGSSNNNNNNNYRYNNYSTTYANNNGYSNPYNAGPGSMNYGAGPVGTNTQGNYNGSMNQYPNNQYNPNAQYNVNNNQYNNNAQGSWQFDGTGYKFYKGGVEVKYSWVRDGAYWYYIGQDGYMKTGWQTVNGKWYYLAPEAGAPMGCLRMGWQHIDNSWYYLGNDGVMQTGYQTINGKNYYFNESGIMLANGTAPNGKTAGADGTLN